MLKFLLLVSVCLNLVLLYVLSQQITTDTTANSSVLPESMNNITHPDYSELSNNSFNRPSLPVIQFSPQSDDNVLAPSNEALNLLLRLANAKQWQELGEPLRDYLQRYPQDTQALFLETQWLFYTAGELEGITAMYQLSEQTSDVVLQDQIKQFIGTFTHSKITRLLREQDWQNLALFVEPLYLLKPESRSYIRALGTAYAYLNLPIAMEDTLANLPSDDTLVRYVRSIWEIEFGSSEASADNTQPRSEVNILGETPSSNTTRLTMDIIPLNMKNQQFFAPVSFAINGESFSNEQIKTELLIDTGASITALTQTTFAQIPTQAKDFQRYMNVKTANGMVRSELYQIAEVRLGEQVFNNIEVLVLPENVSDSEAFNGLLGMNILAQFAFFIDQDNALLELSKLR